ncbi:MAG: phosphate signaling complex protein PhoU [Candidatus Promineifilaceae bacterium]
MPHKRATLDKQLAQMDADIVRLASSVDQAIARAVEALTGRDTQLAQAVIDGDEEINELRFHLEEECLLILATQNPLARDLRRVLAVTHITQELERIGDHAAGIARLVKRLAAEAEILSLHKLPKMARRARQMIEASVQAYLEADAELAHALVRRDDKLDRQYHQLLAETLLEMREDAYLTRGTYLLWAGHNLERIGDRATNIAERVIFMTTGEFVENIPPSE